VGPHVIPTKINKKSNGIEIKMGITNMRIFQFIGFWRKLNFYEDFFIQFIGFWSKL
jgi:hypothetical protein